MSQGSTNHEQFLRTIKPILILSGWWPVEEFKYFLLRKCSKWFLGIYIGILLSLFALILVYIKNLLRSEYESGALGEPVAIAVATSTLSVKLLMLEIKGFSKLIKELKKEEKIVSCSTDKDVLLLYTQEAKSLKTIIIGITYVLFAVIITQCTNGVVKYLLLDKSASLDEKKTADKPIMLAFWLPFKERDHIVIVFLINYVFIFVACVMYYIFYMSLATLLIFTATLFKILQVKIKNLDVTMFESEGRICSDKDLIQIIREHLHAIEFVSRLNSFIKYAVFVDFLFNALNLASVVVQILTVKTFRELFYPLSYTLDMLMQILGLGYLCNEIQVQSLAVADALYQTNWYNKDVRFRRVLLLMMVRAQKPLTISIGPFGSMTTETVFGTMKAAYTYITIMYNNK